jgi:glycosyltransferase involved in cell wall biosynthesis
MYGNQSVTVVHNGIDVAAVRRRATGARADVPTRHAGEIRLLAAGRLVPVKRFDRLPELARALAAETGRPVTILLAGEGPLAAELAELNMHCPDRARVQMLGFQENIAALISEVDALVMTSEHEGLPMVALESAALGRSVYSFDVGGLAEIIGSIVPGALAPAGDTPALAHLIARHIATAGSDSPRTTATLGSCAIQICAGRYAEVYRATLSEVG